MQSVTGAESLFDFGCGRGWLLQTARAMGVQRLAGGDASSVALSLVGEAGFACVELDPERPLPGLDFEKLGFVPEVIPFLDAIEHFAGDVSELLREWVGRLPPGVKALVFEVPVWDGVL